MSYSAGLLGTTGGSTTSALLGKGSAVSTVGQFLDLYIVHFVISVIFIVGGAMLMAAYANQNKPLNGLSDAFFVIGSLALVMNAIFIFGALVDWIRLGGSLTRNDPNNHWLHALSIFAAAFSFFWGFMALLLTFSATLTANTTQPTEVAGYFIVMLGTAFFLYLVVRWIAGFGGKEDVNKPLPQASTTLDTNAVLAAIRAASANSASSQPIFGGASGATAFGGIDLSGLQPSSMSTLPPTQHSSAPPAGYMPMGGGYPMMMMMGAPPQAAPACSPDPNAVHIS